MQTSAIIDHPSSARNDSQSERNIVGCEEETSRDVVLGHNGKIKLMKLK